MRKQTKPAKDPQRENSKYEECLQQALRAGQPTYSFQVGETVRIGKVNHCTIREVLDNGLCYLAEDNNHGCVVWPWYSLRPLVNGTSAFTNLPHGKLHYMNITVEILIMKHLLSGVDLYPAYQREYVWDDKDRERLLDSIFSGVDIGRLIMRERSDAEWMEDNLMYEIIDGKQRLLTLLMYFENRFPYHGVYFNELSAKDRRQFLDTDAALAICHDLDYSGALRIFLATNQSGKAVNDAVIRNAEEQLKKLKENK